MASGFGGLIRIQDYLVARGSVVAASVRLNKVFRSIINNAMFKMEDELLLLSEVNMNQEIISSKTCWPLRNRRLKLTRRPNQGILVKTIYWS